MNIQYRSHTFQVAESDLIDKCGNRYAKVNIGARGLDMWHYIKVDPHLTDLTYTCALPPKPLTVELTPELAANVNASAGVVIVVRKPVTLYHESMAA